MRKASNTEGAARNDRKPCCHSERSEESRGRVCAAAAPRLRALALGVALAALGLYRALISPLLVATLGPACRFEPSCSQYAHQALRQHGLGRGLYLTIRRLMRCRPLGGWGYDPVPASPTYTMTSSLKEKFGQ